jgi:hypothetical protein
VAGGGAARRGVPVVGAVGAKPFFRRRLPIKGIGPDFCEGGGAPVSSLAGRGSEGGRRMVDGSTTSSARSAVEARGHRSSHVVFFFPNWRPGLVLRLPRRSASVPFPFSSRRDGTT